MIRITVVGMALIVFALAGCMDNQEIKSLKKTDASLSDEIAFLNARVKAVEEACLQLNARLMSADQGVTAKPVSSRTAQDKIDSFSAKPELNSKPTRSSLSSRVVGMTIAEALALLGKPDSVSEEAGAQNWIYNGLMLAMEGGGAEQSPALIVFEQGCVARAVLTEKNQDPPQIKESGASNAVVQTNQ